MFTVECDYDKDIRKHLYYSSENEILLPNARQIQSMGCMDEDDGFQTTQLQKIQPSIALLSLSSDKSDFGKRM